MPIMAILNIDDRWLDVTTPMTSPWGVANHKLDSCCFVRQSASVGILKINMSGESIGEEWVMEIWSVKI